MKLVAILSAFVVLVAVPANGKSVKKVACSKEDVTKAVQKDFSAKEPINIDFDRSEVRFEASDYPDKANYRSMRCKFRCEADSEYPVTLFKCNI